MTNLQTFKAAFDFSDSERDQDREFARIESLHGPGFWRKGAGSCAARLVMEFLQTCPGCTYNEKPRCPVAGTGLDVTDNEWDGLCAYLPAA